MVHMQGFTVWAKTVKMGEGVDGISHLYFCLYVL